MYNILYTILALISLSFYSMISSSELAINRSELIQKFSKKHPAQSVKLQTSSSFSITHFFIPVTNPRYTYENFYYNPTTHTRIYTETPSNGFSKTTIIENNRNKKKNF